MQKDLSNLLAGFYSVDITDANSCTTFASIVLSEPMLLQTAIVSTTDYNTYDISCNGYSDGGIDLTVIGDIAGYTYSWSNSWNSEDIYGVSAGTYSVDITDANACTTSTSIVLSEPTLLQTTIASTTDYNTYDISCNGYSDGGIDLTVTGSVAGYTYLWNTSDITEDLNNLTA